ncbi:osiris 11 [Lycorma delicatula]|uniref:osiris 11 n=1 Tax=Lycorma delicatula TaxID=130591 RepID=UPI003F51179D
MKILTWMTACLTLICVDYSAQSSQDHGIISGLRVMYNSYRYCEDQEDTMLCLKGKALKLVDRAIHSDDIALVDGVSLVRRPGSERSLTENTVDSEPLPSEPNAREQKVDSLLWDKTATFFQTHSLQLHVPRLIATSRQLIEESLSDVVDEDGEGRGKKKKNMGPLLVGLMLKGGLIAMAMKGLALLAGKALIVSKLALVLAGIVALKKLFSGGGGGGGEKTTYEIVKQPIVSHAHQYTTSHEYGGGSHGDWAGGHGGGSGGYARSIKENVPYPHVLAYRGQLPASNEQSNQKEEGAVNQKNNDNSAQS